MESEDGTYVPFLFSKPMRLPTTGTLSSRKESATIIFNLALIDHVKNRSSREAVQLYELAMTLLTGEIVDELGIALMNNIGVWCYENRDHEGTASCIGHLLTFLKSCRNLLDAEQLDGIHANVLWMPMSSSIVGSPAA